MQIDFGRDSKLEDAADNHAFSTKQINSTKTAQFLHPCAFNICTNFVRHVLFQCIPVDLLQHYIKHKAPQ